MEASLRVLGPLAVEIGGETVAIRGALKRRLLARLALTPEQTVAPTQLIDAMWGERPPRTASQSLHVHISHLRDTLRPYGSNSLIETTAHGYQLGGGDRAVDASRFESLVAVGRAARAAGERREARDLLADAMAMWGEPFVDLADHPTAMAERQRLASIHEQALDELHDLRLDLSEADTVIPELRALLADHPLRERPYEQLMRAYADRGEVVAALDVYDAACASLHDALGVAPSAHLTELAEAIRATREPLPDRADPDTAQFAATLAEPGHATLVGAPPGVDIGPTLIELERQATAALRGFTRGTVPAGGVSALAPLMNLAGVEPTTVSAGAGRRTVFAQITDGLRATVGVGAVVAIDHVERAGEALVDYLVAVLSRTTGRPFTVVLIDRSERGAEPARALTRLRQLCDTAVAPGASEPIGHLDDATDRLSSLETDAFTIFGLVQLTSAATPAEVVVRASGLATGRAAAAIDDLVAADLVQREPDGYLTVTARGGSIPSTDVDAESTSLRHLAISTALVRTLREDDPQRIVAEARHRLAALPAGDERLAWSSVLAATAHLESFDSYGDIVALISTATELPHILDGGDDLALRVHVTFGRAQIRAGLATAGRQTLERTITAARRAEAWLLFAEAVRALSEQRSPQKSDDALRELELEALDHLDEAPTDTRVQIMTDVANSWYFTDPERADRLATEALDAARAGAAGPTVARALTGLVQARLRPDNAAERLDLALEAQEHARRSDSTESLILALTYEASALIEQGALRRAGPPLQYADALASDVQFPRFRWWVAAWQALLAFAMGELDGIEDRFREAYEIWPSSTRLDAFECFGSQIAAYHLLVGRAGEIVELLVDTARRESAPAYRATAAYALALCGDRSAALDMLTSVVEPGALDAVRDASLPMTLAMTAEAAYAIGLEGSGPDLNERLAPLADVHAVLNVWGGGGFYWGSLRHALGLTQALAGDLDAARDSLSAAARQQHRAGAAVFAQRSRDLLDQLT